PDDTRIQNQLKIRGINITINHHLCTSAEVNDTSRDHRLSCTSFPTDHRKPDHVPPMDDLHAPPRAMNRSFQDGSTRDIRSPLPWTEAIHRSNGMVASTGIPRLLHNFRTSSAFPSLRLITTPT